MEDSFQKHTFTPYTTDGELLLQRDKALKLLRPWWEKNARPLPWRINSTPWGVLVSEVMSQQTPMTRVVPYWVEWMRRWPTVYSCAEADITDILVLWGHLGYPRRALYLHQAAIVCTEKYRGEIPSEESDLLSLPGVGEYTAHAVMSFSFHKRIPVIDTNIRRVLSRVFLGEESIGGATHPRERALARFLLPENNMDSVLWNESLMELGATVSSASSTDENSPLREISLWRKRGYPGKNCARTRTRQAWKGTDRQVRGIILRSLRERQIQKGNSSLPYEDFILLWSDLAQLVKCKEALLRDGLIEEGADGVLKFPSSSHADLF